MWIKFCKILVIYMEENLIDDELDELSEEDIIDASDELDDDILDEGKENDYQ